jgi:hypothetical protein
MNMTIRRIIIALGLAIGVAAPVAALAHGAKGHRNLEVIAEGHDDHKAVDKGMKQLSKGLGVKCTTCHVKGKYERDDLPAKLAAREFLDATIDQRDAEKRQTALAELLSALKLEKPKNEARIWTAVDSWQKRSTGSTPATN